MATQAIRADSAQVTTLPALTSVNIQGVRPFHSHADGLGVRLGEAFAILTMLEDRHDVIGDPDDSADRGDLRHEIQARALEGVKTLIALAVYHNDCISIGREQGEFV